MKLVEVRKNVEKMTFDDTAIEEIDFYNKEFQRHHIGSLLNIPIESHKPIFHLLERSFELQDFITTDPRTKSEIFEIAQQKLTFFLNDFITFLQQNNIEDKTMPGAPE